MKIAVVGCGLIGRSWSLVFARAGHEVALYDADAGALSAALERVAKALEELGGAGMLAAGEAEVARQRIRPVTSLEEALTGAAYVQESVPEQLALKARLFAELDTIAAPATILASSTSGFPASAFTESLAGRDRCLVAHPVNPPHLVPLVELVPAPWTRPDVVAQSRELMISTRQSPIVVAQEIRGFVLNRLQGALLSEAFRLVHDGVCSVDAVDASIRDGLARRWIFMGPFETIDLNAPQGVADYCERYGEFYYEMTQQRSEPLHWDAGLIDRIGRELNRQHGAHSREQRSVVRDRRLARVARFIDDLD